MVWKKRLSEEDAVALQAEMRAAFEAAKIHGIKFPTKRLHDLTGINGTYLWKLLNGKARTTLPTSNKIRDGLRALLREEPTKSDPAGPKFKTHSAKEPRTDRRAPARKRLNESLRASQEPTRQRLRVYMRAQKVGRATVAERSKVCHESSFGYFLGGAYMRPSNYAKLVAWLDAQGAPAASAAAPATSVVSNRIPKTDIRRPLRSETNEALREAQAPMRERLRDHLAAHNLSAAMFARRAGTNQTTIRTFLKGSYARPVEAAKIRVALDRETNGATSLVRQPSLPFPETGSVIAVAARMHSLRSIEQPIEVREEGESSARAIALSVLSKVNLEAIEALIRIAKGSSDEGE